jgi:hypothetical protein
MANQNLLHIPAVGMDGLMVQVGVGWVIVGLLFHGSSWH